MESLGENKESKVADFNKERVVQYLNDNINSISACSGKEIVVILGRTQTGKSTTINALIHGPLKHRSRDGRFVPVEIREGAELAQTGNKTGRSVTPFPLIYTLSEDSVIVDTRGFRGTTCDEEAEIACNIMMTRIFQEKKVRVVVLEKYVEFKGGFSDILPLGTFLSDCFMKQDAPCLFLFNRFEPPQMFEYEDDEHDDDEDKKLKACLKRVVETQELYFKAKKEKSTELERIELEYYSQIVKMIKECFNSLKDGVFEDAKEVFDRIVTEAEKMGIHITNKGINWDDGVSFKKIGMVLSAAKIKPGDEQAFEFIRVTELMEHNFDKGNVAYINPMSELSISELKKKIVDLPFLHSGDVRFNERQGQVDVLKREVLSRLVRFNIVMWGKEFVDKFPKTSLANKNNILQQQKQQCALSPTRTVLIEREITDRKDDKETKEERKTRYDLLISQNVKEMKELKEQNDRIEKSGRCLFYEYSLSGKGVKPTCICVYPYKGVPFVDVKEILEDGTKREETIEYKPEEGVFEAKYGFSFTKDKATSISVGTVGTAASIAMAVIGSIMLPTGVFSIAGVALLAASGACFAGTVTGTAVFATKTVREQMYRRCKGKVQFWVEPKNVPENALLIKQNKMRISQLEETINELKQERDEQPILLTEDEINEKLTRIKEYCGFVDRITTLYSSSQTDMQTLFNVVQFLFGPSSGFAVVEEFSKRFKALNRPVEHSDEGNIAPLWRFACFLSEQLDSQV